MGRTDDCGGLSINGWEYGQVGQSHVNCRGELGCVWQCGGEYCQLLECLYSLVIGGRRSRSVFEYA